MQWKVSVSGKDKIIKLPDQIPDNVAFDAEIDGIKVQARWQRHTRLLMVRDLRNSNAWTSVNLRSRGVAKFPGENELSVSAEFTIASSKTPLVMDATVATYIPGQEARTASASKKPKVVRSQITGKVLKVLVKSGDTVGVGDTLMIIEAMKMENRVLAAAAGTVESIKVNEGEMVASGAELIRYKMN